MADFWKEMDLVSAWDFDFDSAELTNIPMTEEDFLGEQGTEIIAHYKDIRG